MEVRVRFLVALIVLIQASTLLAGVVQPVDQKQLTEKLEKFQSLVERNFVWRAKTTKIVLSMQDTMDKKLAFKAKDVRLLSEYVIPEYKEVQDQLFDIIDQNMWMAAEDTVINFSDDPTVVTEKGKKIVANLNPYDEKGTFYFLHGLNSFAASTLLTDNYLLVFSQLNSKKKVREIIRYEIPGYEGFLKTLNDQFSEMDHYIQFNGVAELFQKFRSYYGLGIRDNLFEQPEFDYLYALIKNSYSLNEVLKDGSMDDFKKASKVAKKRYFKDQLRKLRDDAVYDLSKAFGNFAGSIRWRKGKMYRMAENELDGIKKSLKPLDILLEKTAFSLTDKFIPGHYGHVAIWIGTKQEIQALGIWEHPIVKRYHQEIEEGKAIVEALRPGVQINTLKHFMNIDDLAILRAKDHISDQIKRDYIIRSLKQVGKDYDFNFDVETRTKLICSELIYMVFEDYEWEIDRTLGRYTISPEHVGKRAIGAEPFELLTLYHDGRKITSNKDQMYKKFILK